MENRVYYGEYSLRHWIDLILKENIILPDYQRHFVWNEQKAIKLIETLKVKRFVPPITIGAFKTGSGTNNLILDGQQRLTSVFLAFLGVFPDVAGYKKNLERFANENDDLVEDDDLQDNVIEWTFKKLTEKGKSKDEILLKSRGESYKTINFDIDEVFLKNTFLGFSYLVPKTDNEREQQRYYSSVFRNINIQGETLLAQESRASLYYLDGSLAPFFSPKSLASFEIFIGGHSQRLDFVRYLALLSQYYLDEDEGKVARGYKSNMEKYYEEYIYSVVGEAESSLFAGFQEIFPDSHYESRLNSLKVCAENLDLPKRFNSTIDADVYLFGLVYSTVFRNKAISFGRKSELKQRLSSKILEFKRDGGHTKAPASLKYLRSRIAVSISIYMGYEDA